jgi:hypothetical protein
MKRSVRLGGIATVVATVATSGCEPIIKGLGEPIAAAIGEKAKESIQEQLIIGELGGPMLASLVGVASPLGNPSPLNLLAADAGTRAILGEQLTELKRIPSILDSK